MPYFNKKKKTLVVFFYFASSFSTLIKFKNPKHLNLSNMIKFTPLSSPVVAMTKTPSVFLFRMTFVHDWKISIMFLTSTYLISLSGLFLF